MSYANNLASPEKEKQGESPELPPPKLTEKRKRRLYKPDISAPLEMSPMVSFHVTLIHGTGSKI